MKRFKFAVYAGWMCVFLVLGSQSAMALQPLSQFLDAGKQFSYDNKEALATLRQKHFEWRAALSRLLPSVSATGSYTRNEPAAEAQFPVFNAMGIPTGTNTISIIQQNQWDLTVGVSVPLLNLQAIFGMQSAARTEEAVRQRSRAVQSEVSQAIARAYYQYVASCALREASQAGLRAANELRRSAEARFKQGAITELDVKRAQVEVSRNEQSIADATLAMDTAGRTLETLTNLAPDATACALGAPAMAISEGASSTWTEHVDRTPTVLAAKAELEAARASTRSARASLAPVLNGTFTDRLSNAAGFAGQNNTVAVGASLRWDFGGTLIANAQAAGAAIAASEARYARTRRAVEDDLVNLHKQAATTKLQHETARQQTETAAQAVGIAKVRFDQGAGTQLDWTQAERDRWTADASRIQALANWHLSLALLHIKTGTPLPSGM